MLRRPRRANLVERTDGTFVLEDVDGGTVPENCKKPFGIVGGAFIGGLPASSRAFLSGREIEIALQSRRFVFGSLELPRRAADFLDGIVRAQIDRLTPWTPAEAVFGWSQPSPTPTGEDRIEIVVAAAARETISPIVSALVGLGARSLILSTSDERRPTGGRILIPVDRVDGSSLDRRLKARLSFVAIAALIAFGLSLVASTVLEGRFEASRAELDRTIAERAAALSGRHGSAADAALAALAAKKRSTPATVVVLETLSKALPDDTYLTDFHVEHGAIQIAGLTHDAPALIRLIEQSQRFTHARFSAPTTKSAGDKGERFHIEARIEPLGPASP